MEEAVEQAKALRKAMKAGHVAAQVGHVASQVGHVAAQVGHVAAQVHISQIIILLWWSYVFHTTCLMKYRPTDVLV